MKTYTNSRNVVLQITAKKSLNLKVKAVRLKASKFHDAACWLADEMLDQLFTEKHGARQFPTRSYVYPVVDEDTGKMRGFSADLYGKIHGRFRKTECYFTVTQN